MAVGIERPVPAKELDQHFKPHGALKTTASILKRHFHIAAGSAAADYL